MKRPCQNFATQLVPVCREMDHYKASYPEKSGQAIEYL